MTPRRRILETIKEEMIANINNTTLENIDDVHELNQELFGFAYYLVEIPNYVEPTEEDTYGENAKKTLPQETEEMVHGVDSEDDVPINDLPEESGILHRMLAHGHISTQDDRKVFIPESAIREHNLEQGDIVKFKEINTTSDGKVIYDYELLYKTKTVETDRRVFENGLVERDTYDDSLIVTRSTSGEALSDQQEAFINFAIPKEVADKYEIDEGSIVDLAWYNQKAGTTMRVIWNY